jgi:hypothetical protein
MGFDVHRSTGALRTVIGAVGGNRAGDPRLLEVLDGVQEVLRITEPYKLASRTFKPENSVVSIGDVRIGGDEVIVMAGPCSAENEDQVETRRPRSSAPAPRCSAGARSSLAALLTASRGLAKKASGCCAARPTGTT